MPNRLSRLRSSFKKLTVDAVLVTRPSDVRYLTDFPNEDAWLLVSSKKAYYVTDFRYAAEAKKILKGIELVVFSSSIYETTVSLAKKEGLKVLGIDDNHLSLYSFNRLTALAGKALSFSSFRDAVQVLRSVKDAEEVALIKKAIKVNLEAYRYIKRFIRPGVSEKQLLYRLESFVRERGLKFSFDPIIASGPNSSFPHAKVTERKVHRNEPVLIDLGIDVNGYKSDLTRIFFLGTMSRSFERILSLVRQAQQEAIRVIKPGVEARTVDLAARGFLEKHGLAQYFGHSLGHGVGLDIHESPRISDKSGAILSKGMVITIEPGVYLKKYGVRLEEMVLITKNGCEVLSGNFDHRS